MPPTEHGPSPEQPPVDVRSLKRPDSALLVYYALGSLLLGPFFFFALIPLYFRYHTLRYEFDDEGVSMRWGILFRREIHLTFARIQDIHLTSNVLERWLGLGRVQVQTASGSSKAEMTIEGLKEFEAVRDFLYSRMRGMGKEGAGARVGGGASAAAAGRPAAAPTPGGGMDGETAAELTTTLLAVAQELRELRLALSQRQGPGGGGGAGGAG